MRVLAARFPQRNSASAVLSRLGHALAIHPPDVAIAPLGVPGSDIAGETLLAGRFPDERLPEVIRFVHDGGGEVVANVDERWTVPTGHEDGPPH
jgi:hypothetical protein